MNKDVTDIYIENYNERNKKFTIDKLKEGPGSEGYMSRLLTIENEGDDSMSKEYDEFMPIAENGEKIEVLLSPSSILRRLYFTDEDIKNIQSGTYSEETAKAIEEYGKDCIKHTTKKLAGHLKE